MSYEIQEAWLELLQWCGKHVWLLIIGGIVLTIAGGLLGAAFECWRDRRRHDEPVLYTNGRWTYTKRR